MEIDHFQKLSYYITQFLEQEQGYCKANLIKINREKRSETLLYNRFLLVNEFNYVLYSKNLKEKKISTSSMIIHKITPSLDYN